MKTPEQISKTVSNRLSQTWHDAGRTAEAWPHTIGLALPTGRALEEQWPQVHAWARTMREWAAQHGVQLHWDDRNVVRTPQQLPVKVTIPDQDTAAAVAGHPWPSELRRQRDRAARLQSLFPDTATPEVIRSAGRLDDTDFTILCGAAIWLRANDATGYTPRQVPVPGMHTKWLAGKRRLVTQLVGKPDLGLVDRPREILLTHLDAPPGHRRHDVIIERDPGNPHPTATVAVIAENKDTVLHFPLIANGVAIHGGGYEGIGTLTHLRWLREIPLIIYWGDIDAEGYEILNSLRVGGLTLVSILMDPKAYETYEPYGTFHDARGKPLQCRPRRDLAHLTDTECDVYHQLTDPTSKRTRRVEQERIPLHVGQVEVEGILGAH